MTTIVKHSVPFYPQIFPHHKGTLEGFDSLEEMIYWERKACGAVCIKMIIEYYYNQKVPIGIIVKKGIELNAYSEKGWTHRGLVAIANYYGLSGNSYQNTKLEDIAFNINSNRICIASVIPRLQSSENETKKGGHLILVIGYEEYAFEKYYIIHHPSYDTKYNWNAKRISENELINNFSGNIIVIWK